MSGFAWDPNTRFAIGPSGYWTPVESGGLPLSDFVDVANANGQGSNFIPRSFLPADWQPGMAIQRAPDGSYVSVPFQTQGSVAPYYFHDYSTGPAPAPPSAPPPPPPGDQGGLLGPAPGGLPTSPPVGTAPPPPTSGGLPVSMPNTGGGPVSMPPVGASNPREELERLRLSGLLDQLTITQRDPLRAADFGNGPGQPMTHDPQQAAMFEWVRNNYFGTWDPRQTRGGSNPYYNAPTNGPTSLLPPMQGPIISGPGLLNP